MMGEGWWKGGLGEDEWRNLARGGEVLYRWRRGGVKACRKWDDCSAFGVLQAGGKWLKE